MDQETTTECVQVQENNVALTVTQIMAASTGCFIVLGFFLVIFRSIWRMSS